MKEKSATDAEVGRTHGSFRPWGAAVLDALRAAHGTVNRLAVGRGRRVVAGRSPGYRPWDPEVIGVDTAAERAVVAALRHAGVRGTLLSEEAGSVPLTGGGSGSPLRDDPVFVILDPFDGSLLYRRGIRAHWFTALGIYGRGGEPRAAGLIDHVTGETILADRAGTARLAAGRTRGAPLRPARTRRVAGAYLEAYMMKPSFLYPTARLLRPLLQHAKCILPNGGPAGFADVAAGRIDVYLAWSEALTEVFSALFIAERAGCVVSHWDGSPVRFRPDIHAVYRLVCSANRSLHAEVLRTLRGAAAPKGSIP